MLDQWDGDVKGGGGQRVCPSTYDTVQEWVKVQIIEYQVIESLRRNIRQYRVFKKRRDSGDRLE